MKKSYLKRLICLGIAAFVLCSALAIAAMTGSPYEILKNSAFKGIDIKNGTISIEAKVEVDGIPLPDTMNVNETRHIGDNAELTVFGDGGFSYDCADYGVSQWYGYDEGDGQWYTAYSKTPYGNIFSSSSFTVLSPTESMSPAQRRFAELLVDLLVGDLKNNLSMSERDGIRHITGTLTSAQIPAIVDAGLDLICAESSSYIDEGDYDRYKDDALTPPKKLRVTYVHGDADVDADGNLISLSGEAKFYYVDIFDREREIAVSASARITDIGSTAPECPIYGVKELLEEYRQDGAYRSDIRFRLNEDGTIDRNSIFDNMGLTSALKNITSDMTVIERDKPITDDE